MTNCLAMAENNNNILSQLQDLLKLKDPPRRIEGYDISHQSGENTVGSMVVFINGTAARDQYRKFKIRTSTNDDLKSMKEMISRRLKHKEWDFPDVIILDGGATQVNAILPIVEPYGIPVIGRGKSGDHTRNARIQLIIPRYSDSNELETAPSRDGSLAPVVTGLAPSSSAVASGSPRVMQSSSPSNWEKLELSSNSHIARLVARIDEEAHRFAITYHSLLKRMSMLK